jgi:hypothetical protein
MNLIRLTNVSRKKGTVDIEIRSGEEREVFHCTWDNWGEVLPGVFSKYGIRPELEEEFRKNGGRLEF